MANDIGEIINGKNFLIGCTVSAIVGLSLFAYKSSLEGPGQDIKYKAEIINAAWRDYDNCLYGHTDFSHKSLIPIPRAFTSNLNEKLEYMSEFQYCYLKTSKELHAALTPENLGAYDEVRSFAMKKTDLSLISFLLLVPGIFPPIEFGVAKLNKLFSDKK
jgi:hypothetical protein